MWAFFLENAMLQGISRVVAAVSRVAPDGGQYHGTHRVMFSHIKVGQVRTRQCNLFAAWSHIKGENFPEPKPGKLTRNGIVH